VKATTLTVTDSTTNDSDVTKVSMFGMILHVQSLPVNNFSHSSRSCFTMLPFNKFSSSYHEYDFFFSPQVL
jgi:hypothetical protein